MMEMRLQALTMVAMTYKNEHRKVVQIGMAPGARFRFVLFGLKYSCLIAVPFLSENVDIWVVLTKEKFIISEVFITY